MTAFILNVPAAYGWVIASAVFSIVPHFHASSKVMAARKKYNVEYPNLYAVKADCKDPKEADAFNAIQRGHQNQLETYTQFMVFLLLGGLLYPTAAAVAGFVHAIGRIGYSIGYAIEPKKRYWGEALFMPAFFFLIFATGHLAAKMLGFVA